MRIFNPANIDIEELRKHDRFALLYNNHTDNANLIADFHNSLPEYKRETPLKINDEVYIPFARK